MELKTDHSNTIATKWNFLVISELMFCVIK